MKPTQSGLKPKSRLVARGFEEDCLTQAEKESPTCSKDTVRSILAFTCQKNWDLQTIDIKTAFPQGEYIDREVFVTLPSEANCSKGYIWKLKKCVYGLSDASLKWYSQVRNFAIDNSRVVSDVDPSLFLWYDSNSELIGYLLIHVDDFLFAGHQNFHERIMKKLKSSFLVGKEEKLNFRYLGINISSGNCNITLDQNSYIKNLTKIDLNPDRKRDQTAPLVQQEKDLLHTKIGQLLWISNQTRPDISFDVSTLASNLSNGQIKNILHCNKIIS